MKRYTRSTKVKKYFAIYLGKHKHLRLSGIGRIVPGKEFEVTEKQAVYLRQSENYKVVGRYV